MSLTKFKSTIRKKLKKAAYEAQKKAFEINLRDGESPEKAFDRAAEQFAETFADELTTELANAVRELLETAVIVPALVSPAGPVTGKITITIQP